MTDLRQLHFRFRTDAGTADASPTWGAGEDVNYYPGTANFRLRIGLRNASTVVAATPWELYVSRNGDAYTPVTTTVAKGVQSVDAGASADDTQVLIPRLYPFTTDWILSGAAIDLDFAGSRIYPGASFTDYLSITRASTGYAKTASGTLTSFSTNTLRITDLGLLVEDARTNIVLRSQEFDNASWNAGSSTITANQAVAPDGTTTMDKLTEDTGTSQHIAYQQITITANTTYAVSVFVKDVDRRYIQLSAGDQATQTHAFYCYADLQAGTITDTGSTGSGTFTSASIEAFTGGVYRITVVGKVNATDTVAFFIAALSDRATQAGGSLQAWRPSYTGTSKSMHLWGAQMEAASFASSYIPTSGTSATRAADSVTPIGSLESVIAGTSMTSVVDFQSITDATGLTQTLIADSNSGFTYLYSQSRTLANSYSGVVLSATLGSSLTAFIGAKFGYAQTIGTGRSVVAGGGTVASDAGSITSGGGLAIGNQSGASYAYAYFRRMTMWNSKLADATLDALTAP